MYKVHTIRQRSHKKILIDILTFQDVPRKTRVKIYREFDHSGEKDVFLKLYLAR